MPSTNFLQFDSQQTNMLSDANYSNDDERKAGFVTGISRSILFNKTLFQSSTMSAALANVILRRGYDAMDNNLSSLEDSIDSAFPKQARGLPIGSIFPTTCPITQAPEGFLLPNGQAFDPSEYSELADAYRTGTNTYKYGQNYINGVWWPRTPDLRGYFLRVHNPSAATGIDPGRTVGTSQESANLQHTHTIGPDGGTHQHKISVANHLSNTPIYQVEYFSDSNSIVSRGGLRNDIDIYTNLDGGHTHVLSNNGTTESRPNNFALTYLIVAKDNVNLGAIGGAEAISDLTDVELVSLTNGDVLVYDSTSDKWKNSSKVLKNTSSSSSSLIVGGSEVLSSNNSVFVGTSSYGDYSTAIGSGANNSGYSYSIAIGYGATVAGNYAIQLGYGINSTANTLYVGFGISNNYELLDGTTGIIPIARLGATAGDTNKFLKGDGTWDTISSSASYDAGTETITL